MPKNPGGNPRLGREEIHPATCCGDLARYVCRSGEKERGRYAIREGSVDGTHLSSFLGAAGKRPEVVEDDRRVDLRPVQPRV